MTIKTLDRKDVFKGKVIDLSVDTVNFPKHKVEMERINHPGGAAVVPARHRGSLLRDHVGRRVHHDDRQGDRSYPGGLPPRHGREPDLPGDRVELASRGHRVQLRNLHSVRVGSHKVRDGDNKLQDVTNNSYTHVRRCIYYFKKQT